MKSPVASNLKIAGNINRKGKKSVVVLACGCCWIVSDWRDKERERLAKKEMKDDLNT